MSAADRKRERRAELAIRLAELRESDVRVVKSTTTSGARISSRAMRERW